MPQETAVLGCNSGSDGGINMSLVVALGIQDSQRLNIIFSGGSAKMAWMCRSLGLKLRVLEQKKEQRLMPLNNDSGPLQA
jgi:hypothetical protein